MDEIQDNVNVIMTGNNVGKITGTLKFIEGGMAESGPLSGDGYFLALKIDINEHYPSSEYEMIKVTVGLNPSEGTGSVEIQDDPDKVVVAKITDKDTQNFRVRYYYKKIGEEGQAFINYNYTLSDLVLESQN